MAEIDRALLRLEAEAESKALLEDKSADFQDGFYAGAQFASDYVKALLESYGFIEQEISK